MRLSNYETQFIELLKDLEEKYLSGEKQVNVRTGVETVRIPHGIFQIDLSKEFPILTTKRVYWESALDEILWIMQRQSNKVKDLKPHIWDEWVDKDGTIGKAYGYQVAKPVIMRDGKHYDNQVSYVLNTLQRDPSDRRAVITLWNVDDLKDMNLVPCCFNTVWSIVDGKLNCLLTQRSADYLLGVPFNTTQYAMLLLLFARHLDVKPGLLTHVMADVHVYCYPSHINCMKEMIKRSKLINEGKYPEVSNHIPKFFIYSSERDFFKIKPDDCIVNDYRSMGVIKLDAAV